MGAEKEIRIVKFAPASKEGVWVAELPRKWLGAIAGARDKKGNPLARKILKTLNSAISGWQNGVLANFSDVERKDVLQGLAFAEKPDEKKIVSVCGSANIVFRELAGKNAGFEPDDLSFREAAPDGQLACRMLVMSISRRLAWETLPETRFFKPLRMFRIGNAGLVSDVMNSYFENEKRDGWFSIGVNFGIVPGKDGQCEISPFFSRRRWVVKINGGGSDDIHALAAKETSGAFHFRILPMRASKSKDGIITVSCIKPYQKLAEFIYGLEMPDAVKLAEDPAAFIKGSPIRILLPFNPTNHRLETCGFTGIGMWDQADYIDWIYAGCADLIRDASVNAQRIGVKRKIPDTQSLEPKPIPIVIWHDGKSRDHEEKARLLASNIKAFGAKTEIFPFPCLAEKVENWGTLERDIRKANPPRHPALIILPDKGYYREREKDPKKAIRKALAKLGILSQFIVPDHIKSAEGVKDNKMIKALLAPCKNALLDLRRSCGEIMSGHEQNWHAHFEENPGFIYGARMLRIPYHDNAGKIQLGKVPFICRIDPESMRAEVFSYFLGRSWLPYTEAQIFLCKGSGKYEKPRSDGRLPAFGKGVVFYEKANVRALKIEAENRIAFYPQPFNYLSPRGEAADRKDPDADPYAKHRQTAGIFRHENVFWQIGAYTSEIQRCVSGFSEPDRRKRDGNQKRKRANMFVPEAGDIELLEKWILWVCALSKSSIQYDEKNLLLPLPLHLLKKMEEYAICSGMDEDGEEVFVPYQLPLFGE